jgi:hypothetical protein
MALSKNQLAGKRGGQNPFFQPDTDCLRKFNYSNGAGWRTKKQGKVRFDIKSKRRTSWR